MRALEKLSDRALDVLKTVAVRAEEDLPGNVPADFWSWLRAASAQEYARRHQSAAVMSAEPGFPELTVQELERCSIAVGAMASHEDEMGDEIAPELARFFLEVDAALVMVHGVEVTLGGVSH